MSARLSGPPLHASIARMALLLLGCSRFSSDALLIGADAFAEIASEADIVGQRRIAHDARSLADRLRREAPRRVRPAPALVTHLVPSADRSDLLDRALAAQRAALLSGECITDGEALHRVCIDLEAASMHVRGGAA